MIIESLAKSEAKYLVIQVRPFEGKLHVQILAPKVKDKNRDYGFAFDVKAQQHILDTIQSIIEME